MHDNGAFVRSRIGRLLAEILIPAVYRSTAPVELACWEAPGEPVPFAEARAQQYRPASLPLNWGKPWGTTWFRVCGRVPDDWQIGDDRVELLVDLGFTHLRPGFQAEALVYDANGRILKGLEPLTAYVPFDVVAGRDVELYVEAASNPEFAQDGDFRPTPYGSLETAPEAPQYRMRTAELAIRDVTVWELVQDVRTLLGLVDVLPIDRPRRAEVLRALDQMADALDLDDVGGTAAAARARLARVLASPANASAHTVVATGHAHIDSAWLWPVRETVRKCARTFSNVLDLMDDDPSFVFACSSAQQYAWVKQYYPGLFERIRARVAEGRFVPVGGMWVESDTNMPGGEAMVRQFVAGKRFFIDEFGIDNDEVWLPDSFGYSAALPQIAVGAGARWFFTQKISWNDTNTMPHHTFWWEGIDGTRIFTHFPPADTYNSDISAADLDRAERQFADKGATNISLLPFGWGDGGGGPTREMLAAARRAADLEGLPRVRLGSPAEFFAAAEADYPDAPVWSGEMYLELHRGTYTSQARTKQGNRRSEHLLREAELWAATAALRTGTPYPYDELEQAWHTVLLQQFHDILPGSSIAWVHREAERNYAEVAEHLEGLIDESLAALGSGGGQQVWANAGPVAVDGVPALGAGPLPASTAALVSATPDGAGGFVLDNGVLRVAVDARGLIGSVIHLASGREAVASGTSAGLLQLHRDLPNKWDAWDIDRHYRQVTCDLTEANQLALIDDGCGPQLEVRRSFGASSLVQRIRLRPGSNAVDFAFDIDWHEQRKLLKLAFPLAVHADRFAAETQFGHVWRPTHANTSWDEARYEVCAHRWVYAGEPGFGIGVANDSTYGHDVRRVLTPTGAQATDVRLSLLRAPLYPDPDADQGRHRLACSLVVGAGIADVAAAGYRLNLPLRHTDGGPVTPLVRLDGDGVFVEAVKLAEDRSGDLIVRLYEATGTATTAQLTAGFDWDSVVLTDLLERATGQPEIVDDHRVTLALRPFEIATVRFTPVRGQS